MGKVLVIYSLDSIPTTISAEAASRSIRILKKAGHDVIELGALKALKPFFLISYFFNRFDAIFYFGHGLEDMLPGQLPLGLILPVLRTGDRIRTKVIYAVACLSSKKLGRFLAPRYTRAYLGNRDYTFVAFPATERNYADDFLDTFTTPVRVLAEGDSVGTAFAEMRSRMIHYISLYERNMHRWPNADYYAWAMRENLEGFELIGDYNAKIA